MTPGALSLESFVEAPCNRLALAAVRQLASAGAAAGNPLVLVGARGLGKNHLLRVAAELYQAAHPDAAVEAESMDGLAARALGERGGILPVHECDLLLLEGLERLAERTDLVPLVQEVVDGRVPFGRALVLATALPPTALPDARLAEAVSAGHVITIEAPDRDTRLAILRRRAADLSPALSEEVLSAVASVALANVGELLAALQRLAAFQAVSPAPLEPSQARILIGGYEEEGALAPESARSPDSERQPGAVDEAIPPADDEFGSFLSEVVASVSRQVDEWREQMGAAVLRHGGGGYRTDRLEALLQQQLPGGPAGVLAEYERDVATLQALEADVKALAPELAASPVFFDPDRLGEARAILAQARLRQMPLPGPESRYRLERYGEGAGNRPAVQLARAVIREPGRQANPLLIIGASGTGKTHLLHAIGNALVERGVDGVACLGVPTLIGELQAATPGELTQWRLRMGYAGAVLIDDLHLLAGHPALQEEIVGLLAVLLESGFPVVATSHSPAAAMEGIDARILTRLESGVVGELGRPDRDVRLVVIKQMLSNTPGEGDAALADWLAARPAESVRAVQGMVRQVLGAAVARNVQPTPALAREVLERTESHRGGSTAPRDRRAGAAASGVGRLAQSREKMVETWPRIEDRLFEVLD